jgi:hypothetical protein
VRFLTLAFAFIAMGAQARDEWTSRAEVLKATKALTTHLETFQRSLVIVVPSAAVADQWRTVSQQTAALEALVDTGASFEEANLQFQSLGSALGAARWLMYAEKLCYASALGQSYQSVRLAYRRLDRNMHGHSSKD